MQNGGTAPAEGILVEVSKFTRPSMRLRLVLGVYGTGSQNSSSSLWLNFMSVPRAGGDQK